MGDTEPDILDIPAFLKRDASTNKAPYMSESVTEDAVESRPAKTKAKANGHAKPVVKAAGKAAAKAAPKAPVKAKTAPKAAAKAAKAAPAKANAKVTKAKAESTVKKDQFGFREGSAKSAAVALYARKSGATIEEVKEKLGSVQLNVLFALEEAGHEVVKKKEVREGQRPVTRYFLKLKVK
jgi:hypothetical protein